MPLHPITQRVTPPTPKNAIDGIAPRALTHYVSTTGENLHFIKGSYMPSTTPLAAALALCLAASLTTPAAAQGDPLAFERDVAAAIDAGHGWMQRNGVLLIGGPAAQYRPHAILAVLERPTGIELDAPPVGYAGLDPFERQTVDLAVSTMIGDRLTGLTMSGAQVMALTVYALTGGDHPALRQTIDSRVQGLLGYQNGIPADRPGAGFWGDQGYGAELHATEYAAAGLAAARRYYRAQGDPLGNLPRIDAALALVRSGFAAGQRPDGGHGLNPGWGSSYQGAASGLWVSLLGGGDLDDPTAQGFLGWQQATYNPKTIWAANNGRPQDFYRVLWSSTRAWSVLGRTGDSLAGGIRPADMGSLPTERLQLERIDWRWANRDPLTDRRLQSYGAGIGVYADYLDGGDKPRWYYDYAYELIRWQSPDGRFQGVHMIGSPERPMPGGCESSYECQALALLVLQRSLGGACVDLDADGACDDDDNCPDDANPDQLDDDGDGLGDACDPCLADAECDDGDACTDDVCGADGVCQNPPAICDDGDACTTDTCDPAVGCGAAPVVCDDGDACTDDVCDPAIGCGTEPVVCDDGDLCTTDTCDPAVGCGFEPVVCDDGDACTTDACDPADGACAFDPQCPDCAGATASAPQIWPPNRRWIAQTVDGVTDPNDQPVTITIDAIDQDEPADDNTCPDGDGVGTSTAYVRAERSGGGDGRVYHIGFTATDPDGYACQGVVTACVPHDRGHPTCGDDGPLYDALTCE